MTDLPLHPLPLLGDLPTERSDAARNREALMVAARELVRERGADGVTMDDVALRAGVGKGTVFRRFGSRHGLMVALLDDSETEWQRQVMSGPPPLGPGAPAWDRLEAFGRSRLLTTIGHGDLLRAAGAGGNRSAPAMSFVVMHVRHLLIQLGVTGDLRLLSTALMAPLEIGVLDVLRTEGIDTERVVEGWLDLAKRIVAGG